MDDFEPDPIRWEPWMEEVAAEYERKRQEHEVWNEGWFGPVLPDLFPWEGE